MKINIAMGFFLPVPPLAGGATEKTWHGLSREFARRGHEVTVLSRRWPDLPETETSDGVGHLRLRGYSHTPHLLHNLWLDLSWSARVWRALPPADVTVVNCVALPLWLGRFRRAAGRVVIMPGRMPKGQFRLYSRLDRVLAVSSAMQVAIIAENPRLAPIMRVCGYPINWRLLAQSRPPPPAGTPVTIGYIGRLHREKGLGLMAAALAKLAERTALPAWRVLLCGPTDVVRGGSGREFGVELTRRLAASVPPDRFRMLEPVFSEERLAAIYRQIDIFCYPSLAVRGETFGVAVAEAMAAGAVPVVSRLGCFTDFVRPDETGVVFDHTAAEAAGQLADALAGLLSNVSRRIQLAAAAQAAVQIYDYPVYAQRMLEDFSTLLPAARRQS
ncbi:MAG: glycosyltransferase family 4 protein [Bryobacteraceae bacterium]|jgi:glycosyltransferase involved in cell wall biosynthesis